MHDPNIMGAYMEMKKELTDTKNALKETTGELQQLKRKQKNCNQHSLSLNFTKTIT